MKLTRYLSSPTFLLLAIIWLAIIGLTVSLSSCRKKADATESVIPVDTLTPKITNLHIPGIPAENIKIDQVKRQLIVTLPTSLTAMAVTGGIWVQLTPGARLNRFRNPWLSLCDGTFSNNSFEPILPGRDPYDYHTLEVTDGERTKSYRLQLKPAGDMYFDAPNKTFQMKSDGTGETFKNLRVMNYTDTSRSAKILYKNLFTGEETAFDVPSCAIKGDMFPSSGVRNLSLGYYDIAIVKSNGRKTTKSLRMLLTAGKPSLDGFGHALNQGFFASVSGNSLYDGSLAGLALEGVRNKVQYRLKINKYSRDGQSMTVELPKTIMTGTYNARLVYKDGTRSDPKWSYIHKTTIQPVIGSQFLGVSFTDSYNDITLRRGSTYYIYPSPSDEIARGTNLNVVLQSLASPRQTYRIPVSIPSGYQYIPNPWRQDQYPTFFVPSTVLTDKYQLRLEYNDVSGILQVGEWLDWYFMVE